MELEDKFDRVGNFSIHDMHLVTTTLHLMQTNQDRGNDDKEVETNHTLYGFLAND